MMAASPTAIETIYVRGGSLPWVPFVPLSEQLLVRYVRIDPLRGEIIALVRFPPELRLEPYYHTGTLIAHTVRGAWRYREHDWVSEAGDTVYTAAGAIHTLEGVGDEEAVVFLVFAGELLFFDEDGNLVWQESSKTSMERYAEYCAQHHLGPRDLTGFAGPAAN